MIVSQHTPITVKLQTGEWVMGLPLEMRIGAKESPTGRMCLLLKDPGQVQQQRTQAQPTPDAPDGIHLVYTILAWQVPEAYIPWDKIMAFGLASDTAAEYYRRVFGKVQLATGQETQAISRKPGVDQVFHTP